MTKIGVVFPRCENKNGFLKRLFSKNKYETVIVEEYNLEFMCMYDNQNYSKVFPKNNVENVVLVKNAQFNGANIRVLNGERIYKRMLPDYVRKIAKKIGGKCTVTVVDKNLTDAVMKLIHELCSVFETVNVCTEKVYDAQRMCDRLLDNLGVVITVVGNDVHIDSDIVVVLEDCGNSYGQNCVVINKNQKRIGENCISDFYIPFDVKPPFGMSNLVFAECVELNNK